MAKAIQGKRKTILVTGAGGPIGGAVMHSLLVAGWKVRALVSDANDPSSRALYRKGADLVIGEGYDLNSLELALKGVYGVFSVQMWEGQGIENEIRQGNNLANAAARNEEIKLFIYASTAGANLNTGISFFDSKATIENHIRSLGLPSTIFRPVYFMFKFSSPEMQAAIMKGTLTMAVKPEKHLQLLAADDLGEFARIAFEHPDEYKGKAMELAGDEMTMSQVAAAFSRVIGKTVRYVYQPIEAMPLHNADRAKMFAWLNKRGYQVDIPALIELHPGLMSFETWLHKSRWVKAAMTSISHGS